MKMSYIKNPFVAFDQLSNKCLLPKLSLAINEKPHYLQLFQNEKLYKLIIIIFICNKHQPKITCCRYFFNLR